MYRWVGSRLTCLKLCIVCHRNRLALFTQLQWKCIRRCLACIESPVYCFLTSRLSSRDGDLCRKVIQEERVNSVEVRRLVDKVQTSHHNTYESLAEPVLVGGVCLTGFVGALTQSPSRISVEQSEPSSSVTTVFIPEYLSTRYSYSDKYFQDPSNANNGRWSSRDGVCGAISNSKLDLVQVLLLFSSLSRYDRDHRSHNP